MSDRSTDHRPSVCIFAYKIPPHYGGAGGQATRYARYLAAAGDRVTLLTSTPDPWPIEGVRIVTLDLPEWYRESKGGGVFGLAQRVYERVLIPRLARWLRKEKIDVLHCVAAKMFSLIGVAAAHRAGVKSVLETSLLGQDDLATVATGLMGPYRAHLFHKADIVVDTSPSLQAASLAAGVSEDHLELIVNPVDTDRFSPVSAPEKAALRTTLGVPAAEPLFVSIGIVRRRKNTLFMVRAFADYARSHPEGHLAVVGPLDKDAENRAYADEVRQAISEAGLEDRVTLVGFTRDPESWLRAADVFVFASESEGLPNAVAEALASGLPVVSTPVQTIASFMIREGEDGFVVETEGEMAAALGRLTDGGELAAFSANARASALARFDEPVVMETYRTLYQRLASA